MIFKWGLYAHGQDEIGVKIRKRGIFDSFGRRMGTIEEWHIVGNIKGTSQVDITTKLAALELAYDTDYKDAVIYLNDGATETQHKIDNSKTFGGVHVVDFGYISGPWKMRTEYANKRTFYIVLRAEHRTGTGIYSYHERLVQNGTGASKWAMMHSLNALPIAQNLNAYTSVKYVQQGVAVGRTAYPAPPAAMWSAWVHGDLTKIEYLTPEDLRWGTGPILQNTQQDKFGISWTYVMEAPVAGIFGGFPGIVM